MLYYIGRFIFFVIFRLLFGFRVFGQKNIPKNEGFIIASNHESNFDPILIGVASRRAINFMAKEELFCNKFVSFILRRVLAFPVKRGAADLGAIKEAVRRLKSGSGLLLFPQGGRRQTIEISDARKGVGLLAKKSGVCIVPAYISGSAKALPPGSKIPHRARISVYFGSPIRPNSSQDYEQTAQEIMSAIHSLKTK